MKWGLRHGGLLMWVTGCGKKTVGMLVTREVTGAPQSTDHSSRTRMLLLISRNSGDSSG